MKRKKYDYDVQFFREESANFYYLLGVLLTDGNIFFRKKGDTKYRYGVALVQLTSKDIDWLKIMQKMLRCAVYHTKDGHGNLVISSKEICEILIRRGLNPKKSLTVELPKLDDKFLPDLLRGIVDGDGSIHKSQPMCSISSSSPNFLKDINLILSSNGIASTIYDVSKPKNYSFTLKNGKVIKPRNAHFKLVVKGAEITKSFLSWLYYDKHELSMPRKNERAQQILKSR